MPALAIAVYKLKLTLPDKILAFSAAGSVKILIKESVCAEVALLPCAPTNNTVTVAASPAVPLVTKSLTRNSATAPLSVSETPTTAGTLLIVAV